jgi:hypothetical protein
LVKNTKYSFIKVKCSTCGNQILRKRRVASPICDSCKRARADKRYSAQYRIDYNGTLSQNIRIEKSIREFISGLMQEKGNLTADFEVYKYIRDEKGARLRKIGNRYFLTKR